MLEKGGTPAIVSRTLIAPPGSRVGPITAEERAAVLAQSPLRGKYDVTIDRDSAFEVLNRRGTQMVEKAPPTKPSPWSGPQEAAPQPPSAQPSPWTHKNAPPTAPAPEAPSQGGGILDSIGGMIGGAFGNGGSSSGGRSNRMSTGEMILRSAAQSAARSIGTQITRAILRNVLGGMKR